jgi:hypothetical protein
MPVHVAMPFVATAVLAFLTNTVTLADPPSGLPEIPPSSTFPAAAPAAPAPAAPPAPSGAAPVPSAPVPVSPSVTVGGFDASGLTSFRFGEVDVPAGEISRRLGLEVGLRLGAESGVRLVDADGGFPSDYAVTGTVETAGLSERVRTIKASGYVYRDGNASLTAIARLVRRSDGLVVWSDRVRVDLGREALERIAPTDTLPEAAVARLVADAGERIASEALDRLAPLEVESVDGGLVRLNRGGADLGTGSRLRVLSPGATSSDPRTVAILEIRSVSGGSPVASVIEGDASLVTSGLRLKRIVTP